MESYSSNITSAPIFLALIGFGLGWLVGTRNTTFRKRLIAAISGAAIILVVIIIGLVALGNALDMESYDMGYMTGQWVALIWVGYLFGVIFGGKDRDKKNKAKEKEARKGIPDNDPFK